MLAIFIGSPQKQSGPGFLRGPTYTARGVHPTVPPSQIYIVPKIAPVKPVFVARRRIISAGCQRI
jgi:hypothetical protein